MNKFLVAVFFVIFALSISVAHAEPSMSIRSDKEVYTSGETGTLEILVDTYGEITEAELEVEILTPEGKIVYGALLYTSVPAREVLNPETWETEKIVIHEDVRYDTPQKTISRTIVFQVPHTIPSGMYTINARLVSPGTTLRASGGIEIFSHEYSIDMIIIVYILVLAYSIYLLRRK